MSLLAIHQNIDQEIIKPRYNNISEFLSTALNLRVKVSVILKDDIEHNEIVVTSILNHHILNFNSCVNVVCGKEMFQQFVHLKKDGILGKTLTVIEKIN